MPAWSPKRHSAASTLSLLTPGRRASRTRKMYLTDVQSLRSVQPKLLSLAFQLSAAMKEILPATKASCVRPATRQKPAVGLIHVLIRHCYGNPAPRGRPRDTTAQPFERLRPIPDVCCVRSRDLLLLNLNGGSVLSVVGYTGREGEGGQGTSVCTAGSRWSSPTVAETTASGTTRRTAFQTQARERSVDCLFGARSGGTDAVAPGDKNSRVVSRLKASRYEQNSKDGFPRGCQGFRADTENSTE